MMKRYFLLFWILTFFLPVCIASTDDVTMVSYEQGWLDSRGTIALKNNTNEEIHNVAFQITYLDMSGKALDYEEFTESITIAPGMTRKIDIPAYEHDRNYHYYKSENKPGGSPSFKIEYKLLNYNIKEVKADDDLYGDYRHDESEGFSSLFDGFWLFAILAAILCIGIAVGLYVLVAVMAQQRHKNVVVWILLSMLVSPLIMVIILLCIGDSQTDSTGDDAYQHDRCS